MLICVLFSKILHVSRSWTNGGQTEVYVSGAPARIFAPPPSVLFFSVYIRKLQIIFHKCTVDNKHTAPVNLIYFDASNTAPTLEETFNYAFAMLLEQSMVPESESNKPTRH